MLHICDWIVFYSLFFAGLNTDLSSLKEIIICGSPVKKENFEYLLTKVKKDLFVGIMYGNYK